MKTTIETNNKELNKRIERVINYLPGKPTVGKVLKMFLVDAPTEEYLKAYLKRWY